MKPFFLHNQKVMTKLKYLGNKRPFKMKYTVFFIIFKALSMKQITQFFLEVESPTLTLYTFQRN